MTPLATWKLISESLHKKVPVMLLYVLESIGSSPGRKDFLMAVNSLGEMEGSMGGGIMEHKFVELAKSKLVDHSPEASIHQQIHDKEAALNQSGMICSGEQTIFLYKVQHSDLPAIDSVISILENAGTGILQLSNAGIICKEVGEIQNAFFTEDKNWKYETRIGYTNHLYIVGGGHCALALSRLMYSLGFYIHLFDDRKDLHTMQQNQFVHEMKVLTDYAELKNRIPEGNHFVVIMTFGYRTDDEALRAIMDKSFSYLGVLGSKFKIDKMLATYSAEGIPESVLEKIHAPIGLPINSQTPEEIAISIAAEIIQVKNSL